MTVSAQTLAFEYAANGVTTTFPYGFRVLYADQVKVYVNGTLQVGGYTLTGVGDAGGGNVVFTVAPVNGSTVLVRRISDRVRTTDFQQAPYFTQEELLDQDQDYQTMLLQEASADAVNAIRIPAVETNVVELPDAATRANKFLQFTGTGDVALSDGTGNNATTYFTATKSAGDTLAASLADGATVIVTADESQGGVRVRYTVASAALTAGIVDTAVMAQFTQAGTGAVARTAQSKMRESVSILDFGAPTDGIGDCFPAFTLAYASIPDTGGTILFPGTVTNKWFFSQTIVLNKPVRIVGQLPASSLFVVNTGTVLEFAADKNGIVINSYNSQGANPTGSPAGNWCEVSQLSVVSRGGANGLNNGGTGIACDGILVRGPGARLKNVWSYFFRRNGVRIAASIGAGGAMEGNANLWYLSDVHCLQSGGDGLYVDGLDANAGLALKVNCSNNAGWGIVDSSFLGNTYIGCHTDGNTLGPIMTDDPNAQSVFIGCYAENGEASLVSPTIMIGGLNSSSARISSASTAFVLGGGGGVRMPFKYLNTKGSQTVGGAVGQNDNSLSAMTWGASSESATTDAWKLKFDIVSNVWAVEYANSTLFTPIRYPNSASSLYLSKGFTGPILQNGYAVMNVGGSVADAKVRLLGLSAPTVGTYSRGDIVYNSEPSPGGFIGFVCVTSGSPGTWKTYGAISA